MCKSAVLERSIKLYHRGTTQRVWWNSIPIDLEFLLEKPISKHTSVTDMVSNVEEKFSSFKEQKVMTEKTDFFLS